MTMTVLMSACKGFYSMSLDLDFVLSIYFLFSHEPGLLVFGKSTHLLCEEGHDNHMTLLMLTFIT
jgi:hypothetical protein